MVVVFFLSEYRNDMSKATSIRYRPNVAGILQDAEGRILIGERMGAAGAWQFPQGGINPGESREEAFFREMEEELGLHCGDYQIVACNGPYRYVFDKGRTKQGYRGQEQTYFLARFVAPAERVNIATNHQEFRKVRWIFPHEFKMAWLPDFKKAVYRKVFMDFFALLK